MQGVAGSLASGLSGAAVEAEQACYLPLSSDGLPVIGRCVALLAGLVEPPNCWNRLVALRAALALPSLSSSICLVLSCETIIPNLNPAYCLQAAFGAEK